MYEERRGDTDLFDLFRHLEDDLKSFPGLRADLHLTIMELHDPFDDRKTDSDTRILCLLPDLVDLIEFFRYEWKLILSHPESIILECDQMSVRLIQGLDRKSRILSGILGVIREHVVEYLLEFVLIGFDGISLRDERDALLGILGEYRSILVDRLFREVAEVEIIDEHISDPLLFLFLILHDGIRDLDESFDLVIEHFQILLIKLDHSVLDSFDVAFYGGNRGLYLMAEVRQEIRSDLLLNAQALIEVVDRLDEGVEFILPLVEDVLVFLLVDDIGKIFYDRAHRAERVGDPDECEDEDDGQDDQVEICHGSQSAQDEYPLRSRGIKLHEIQDIRKEGLQSIRSDHLLDGRGRDTTLLHRLKQTAIVQGAGVFGEILKGRTYLRQILGDVPVLFDELRIQLLIIQNTADKCIIEIGRLLFNGFKIGLEILARVVFECQYVRKREYADDQQGPDDEFVGELH